MPEPWRGNTEGTPARSPRHPRSLVFPMVGEGHAAVSAGLSQWDEPQPWRAKVAIHHRPLRRCWPSPAEMANCLADTIGADHLYQDL